MRVLPTRWQRKPAGIDMNRNYVTVTLCITVWGIWNAHPFLRVELLVQSHHPMTGRIATEWTHPSNTNVEILSLLHCYWLYCNFAFVITSQLHCLLFRSFAGCVSTNVYLVCTVWRGLRNGLGKRVNWRNGSTIRCISNSGDTPAPPLKARFCHHQRPLCVAMRSTPAFHRKCPVNEHEIAKKSCGWREIRRVNGSKSRKNCIAGGQFRELMLH